MKMFRDSRGSKSTGATFGLTAAIRRNDRSGPGMVTISSVGDAGVPLPAEAQSLRQKKAATKMAKVQRGRFIIGYLFKKTLELHNSPSLRQTGPRDCKSSTAIT